MEDTNNSDELKEKPRSGHFSIIGRYLRGNRMYVKVDPPINGKDIVANAIYVWLMGNPAFEAIPKGYVIHHLDGDEMNDDISNLVLMQKNYHISYHVKNKHVDTGVAKIRVASVVGSRTIYFPAKEPYIYHVTGPHRKSERYRIGFPENLDGTVIRTWVNSWEGIPISTREMADKIKALIWDGGNHNPSIEATPCPLSAPLT